MLNVVEPARYIKVNLLFLHSEVHLRGEERKLHYEYYEMW